MNGRKGLWALSAVALLMATANAVARDDPALIQRVERMERVLDSGSMLEMLKRIDQLQREVQQLRGDLEVQTNSLNSLQQRQRELYLDIDRRLHRLEVGGVQAAPGTQSLEPAMPPADVAPAPSSPDAMGGPSDAASVDPLDTMKERDAYEHALDILKEGRYGEAAKAFRVFRSSYPGSRYAANAQYWLGEAYYVTRDFDTALQEFTKVVEEFPGSSKVADAQLKRGFIQYERKDWAEARKTLESVVARFPDSTAARLSNDRLERMTKEGH